MRVVFLVTAERETRGVKLPERGTELDRPKRSHWLEEDESVAREVVVHS